MGPGNRVAADDLVPLVDQILDGDVKVWEGPVDTSLSGCAPVASIGNEVWITASGSTSSSIVLEMSSASPVVVASWKRLTVALLLGSCAPPFDYGSMRGTVGW